MTHHHIPPPLYLALSLVLCLGGIAAFLYLFVRDFNVYWLILSPVIIALYQVPAVYLFWLYKRARLRRDGESEVRSGEGPPAP